MPQAVPPPPRLAPVEDSPLPESRPDLEHVPSHSSPPADPDSLHDVTDVFETEPDEFGLFRSYTSRPTYIPDEDLPLDAVCDTAGLAVATSGPGCQSVSAPLPPLASADDTSGSLFSPFLNPSVFRLVNWFYNGSNMKSVEELDRLVNDVVLAEDFNPSDLRGFRAAKELNRLDSYRECPEFSPNDGWIEISVKISLPAERNRNVSESDAPQFEVKGLFYRPLTEVIKSVFQEASAEGFHLTPFRLFWQRSTNEPPERVISEMYNSDAFIEEHEKIRSQSRKSGSTLETVVASVMLWSDSTHLAQFGTASLWPIYAFFGNQSKYTRAKPTSFSANHIAYIPSVSHLYIF